MLIRHFLYLYFIYLIIPRGGYTDENPPSPSPQQNISPDPGLNEIMGQEVGYMLLVDQSSLAASFIQSLKVEFPDLQTQDIHDLLELGIFDSRYRYISSNGYEFFKNIERFIGKEDTSYIKYYYKPKATFTGNDSF